MIGKAGMRYSSGTQDSYIHLRTGHLNYILAAHWGSPACSSRSLGRLASQSYIIAPVA